MLDKLKQLTKDTATYGISTIVGRFLNFILVPFYTNIFLPAEYGIITNFYAFIALMNIFFLYGMDSAFLKYGSDAQKEEKKDTFSTPFLTVLATGFLLAGIIVLMKGSISNFLGAAHYEHLIYYTAIILFLDAVAVIPFVNLRLERKAKKFSLFKVLNIITNVVFNLILVWQLNKGIEAVFISNIAASLLSLILVIPDISKNLKFRIDKEILRKILKFGLPYLPAGIGAMVIQVIDRPIMEHLTSLEKVGIYQANHKLGIFMMLFVNMFQFAWQPFFLQNSKETNAKDIFSKVLTYFTLIGGVILVVLSLFINEIVAFNIHGRHFIGKEYWSGLPVVPIVLLGYLFNGIYIVFTAGIFIKEKSIYVPFIIGFAAIVHVVSNFLLIPQIDIMGAAVAALISYTFMAVGFFVVTQRIYKIDYEYAKLAKIFLLITATGIIYYKFLLFGFVLYKLLLFIVFLLLLVLLVFDKKEIAFLKSRIHGKNRS